MNMINKTKTGNNYKIRENEKFTCLFLSLEGTLLASLAVCTAASADAASGVARKISHISCWHSLYDHIDGDSVSISSII